MPPSTVHHSYENVRLQESLANTLALEGKNAEAEPLIRESLATIEKIFNGEATTMSAELAYELARVRAGDADGTAEALEFAQRAEGEFARMFGEDSPRTQDVRSLLATLRARPSPPTDHPVSPH